MSRRPDLRRDEGLTLVEMLVTMALAGVVLFAILGASDILGSSTQDASRVSDSQELSRQVVRRITNDARQAYTPTAGAATPIASVARNQLVFAAAIRSGSSESPGWIAYCADANGSLYRGQLVAGGYVAPTACGTNAGGWTFARLIDRRVVSPSTLFSYTADAGYTANGCPQQAPTPATPNPTPCLPAPAAVRAVGLRLAVSRKPGSTRGAVITNAAVSLRNAIAQ
ncbi:PulJ/GspJ family protein [Patulibacter defluvii]|uniref:PulJ/GspJ family protein n=1 Tax=Patulibacter defluvii TaxID=3095358 RepID=UPI002A7587F1|nr:prepilin-type N-terminal cleavage/methylation domain-containing protein [Patulibacter sp. DM4]